MAMGGDTVTETRRMQAGGATFAVRADSAELVSLVESLFVDLPDASSNGECRQVDLRVGDKGQIDISVDHEHRASAQRVDGALAALVSAVSRLALDHEPERLHLHCAALSRNDQPVLLSAASGTGKTTVAAALADRGWTYLSDEAVALDPNSVEVTGFPKPLVLKDGGQDLVPAVHNRRLVTGADPEAWSLIPASLVPTRLATSFVPSTVVILQRGPDGTVGDVPTMTPLHPTDAVVALMGQTMDSQRFGPDALRVLCDLTARCRCVALSVGPIDAMCGLLEDLVETEFVAHPVAVLEWPVDGEPNTLSVRATDTCRSVAIGDRVVLHETVRNAVAALDEAGSALWLAFHGAEPSWWQPETLASPDVIPFIEQLAEHGFVSIDRERTGE